MRRVLFIDRDGTLIIEPPDEQIDSHEKLDFYPGVFNGLGRIARSGLFDLVMVTNQDGLGTERFPEQAFQGPHNKMLRTFEREGIRFADVHIDRSYPSEGKSTRKPGTGMLTGYISGTDLPNSFVIGDRISDIELARNLGAKGILVGDPGRIKEVEQHKLKDWCALVTPSWEEIYKFVCTPARIAEVHRKTSETDIRIALNLDGSGQSSIQTGLGFLDHMLDQLSRHGRMDLNVRVKGDLHIDEHHTIEDTALALGEAMSMALGNKKGLERYGFCLPMDDALAQVSIDLGGRPWLKWEAEFAREKIGDMPTEMFFHFFKSFTDTAKCTLHVKAEGQNEHHKIEAIFKAFARALRMAVKTDGSDILPTTKGAL